MTPCCASLPTLPFPMRKLNSVPFVRREQGGLLKLQDRRISKEGVIIIKAQQYRSQEKNRDAALQRLQELIRSVAATQKKRRPTKPTKAAKQKRLDQKTRRGKIKAGRGKVSINDG